MRQRWFLCVAIVLLLLPQFLVAQEGNDGQTFLSRSSVDRFGNRLPGGLSLLNPSKFSMSHSYTMSYSSSGGKGTMMGLYMNSMNYRFSQPLSVTVHVGYLHQPFGKADSRLRTSNSAVLSGLELTYRPSQNFFLKIEYGTTPFGYSPYYRNGLLYDR